MGESKEINNVSLGIYFAMWYVGNSFYNIQNKRALNATGGKTAGYGMTVATLQVCRSHSSERRAFTRAHLDARAAHSCIHPCAHSCIHPCASLPPRSLAWARCTRSSSGS